LDTLILKFLLSTSASTPKQIVSLGAGSDTRYFRFITSHPSLELIYHELDFPTNTTSKVSTIKSSPILLKAITTHPSAQGGDAIKISADGSSLTSPGYNIHAVDLRDFANVASAPELPNLNKSASTLILSECCLIYLPPETTTAILQTLTEMLIPSPVPLSLVMYEPINPHDAFGRTMVQNLLQRGINLQTLSTYPSLQAQKIRLKEAGFTDGQEAADVDWIFESEWTGKPERDRVARCEMLDEVEEWKLLARHYCVAWGWRGDIFGDAWRSLGAQDTGDR
jgi:[phosphatase 2A protein]-leucine-carboxy methyltransferase